MAGKIIENNNITGTEGWAKLLFNPCSEALTIDWLIKHEGSVNAIMPQNIYA